MLKICSRSFIGTVTRWTGLTGIINSRMAAYSTTNRKNIVTEEMGNLFLIGINRPEKRNCVNSETALELVNAFEEFEKNDNLYVAILHGKGGNFCAGMDLAEVSRYKYVSEHDLHAEIMNDKRRPMGPTQKTFSKPTIAAVSGYAVAGGLELALLCDLRVVEETAIMGVFCRRFGVPLMDGGTVRLPKIVGLSRALDMILTGRGVDAKEALEMGLANRVVACGSALGQAINLGNSICKFPQKCMRADRNSAFYSVYAAESIEDALAYEWEHSKSIIFKESVEDKNVLTERLGNVFLIGINRPSKRNCVNSETAQLLLDAFEEFEKDDSLYVSILYGKEGNFCAGYDLSELSNTENALAKNKEALIEMITANGKRRPMGPTHMLFSKPTIAAVSGYAVAGGLELALLCDLRVIEENANMGVFCRRFGVPLLDGGTVRLPHIVGLGRALDMILTGRAVNAREAFAFGLANRVVPNGTALDEAIKLANSLCKFPQECMRADRRSAFYAVFDAHSLEDALQYEWAHSSDVIFKESIHGASRFVSGVGRHGEFNSVDKPEASKL